jgi:pimeloyl-ACP methyl ester carboxylesterase
MRLKTSVLFFALLMAGSGSLAASPWHTEGIYPTPWGEVGYRIAGDGPPLLLLHGYFGQGRQWEPFLEAFSAHYTVIAPDLLGHGTSMITGENFEVAASAEALWQLLDALALSEIRAVGYSAGGMTLLKMAAQRPTAIEAMILASSAHVLEAAPPRPSWETMPPSFQADMLRNHPRGVPQIKKLISMALIETLEDQDLAPVKTKTLLLVGDRDEVFPVPSVLQTYQALPNAQLWIVPNLGHALFWPWGGSDALAKAFPARALQFFSEPPQSDF